MTATAFDSAFRRVGELVATFKANEARYLSADYHEAEVRKDFIDKFFIALGWDVNHDRETNPYEQEVKVEPPVSAAGQRRADYSFRLAPNFRDVRFFVEAKTPHGHIATPANYHQTIRYGWNSETPLAALTSFEQFHILDCRYKPDLDTALNRCVSKYHYTDYTNMEKFKEIYWLFSREAVTGDSLEKRAKELPKPRGKAVQWGLFAGGYQSIDESFLQELDGYRIALVRAFKNRNPKLDSNTLTELAQRTLDRLVLLRFLEDKGIEAERLMDHFGDKGPAWEDFIAASRRLDGIYNGIVYKRHDILDDDKLRVDDDAFADICESLSHINSPYDFNAIPIHILGSIYERFLGKIIIAKGRAVRVEDKPEVRKAGGVYYTPEYIVRYIVENTVGKLIAGKTPAQISEMRFADIACGSGSFLLGIYDLLLQYHGHYYNNHPSRAPKGDVINRDGELYLSLRAKRRILVNNIYGVDIDAQAVEVCQLSLYLKLLQEETEASAHQLDFEKQTLLPSLSKNIVCGNSLVGRDILEGQLFASDEERKLNSMNFEDAFPEVMKRGGFDAIVGNPPYVFGEFINEIEKDYFALHYKVGKGQYDLYHLFFEGAISHTKPGGYHGYIIPDAILARDETIRIRKMLLEENTVRAICHAGNVFQGVGVSAVVIVTQRGTSAGGGAQAYLQQVAESGAVVSQRKLSLSRFSHDPKMAFTIDVTDEDAGLLERVRSHKHILSGWCEFSRGEELAKKDFKRESKLKRSFVWILVGEDVHRYSLGKPSFQIRKSAVEKDASLYNAPKLIIVKTGARPNATLETDGLLTMQSLYNGQFKNLAGLRPEFFLALVNSALVAWYLRKTVTAYKKMFPQFNQNHFEDLPVPAVDFAIPTEKQKHDEIVVKVKAMLVAKKQLAAAKTDKDKTYYENKCASLDGQIDRLVYGLYGLTAEEIVIVEKANTSATTKQPTRSIPSPPLRGTRKSAAPHDGRRAQPELPMLHAHRGARGGLK